MPPGVRLPDEINFIDFEDEKIEEVSPEEAEDLKEEIKIIAEAEKSVEVEEKDEKDKPKKKKVVSKKENPKKTIKKKAKK